VYYVGWYAACWRPSCWGLQLVASLLTPHPAVLCFFSCFLTQQVDKDLREMLIRPDAPKPRKVAVRVWPKAIPQVNHWP
jgi:hypothetical protein